MTRRHRLTGVILSRGGGVAVAAGGKMETVAGTGQAGYSGDGGKAHSAHPLRRVHYAKFAPPE